MSPCCLARRLRIVAQYCGVSAPSGGNRSGSVVRTAVAARVPELAGERGFRSADHAMTPQLIRTPQARALMRTPWLVVRTLRWFQSLWWRALIRTPLRVPCAVSVWWGAVRVRLLVPAVFAVPCIVYLLSSDSVLNAHDRIRKIHTGEKLELHRPWYKTPTRPVRAPSEWAPRHRVATPAE